MFAPSSRHLSLLVLGAVAAIISLGFIAYTSSYGARGRRESTSSFGQELGVRRDSDAGEGAARCAKHGATLAPLKRDEAALAARVSWSDDLLLTVDRFSNQATFSAGPSKAAYWADKTPYLETAYSTYWKKRSPHAPFDLLGPVGPVCTEMVKFGHNDDEKRACAPFFSPPRKQAPPGRRDHHQAASLAAAAGPACHVVSIGSKNQWDFEKEVVANTPCTVSTWDCTGHKPTGGSQFGVPAELRKRVRFFDTCIGTKDIYRKDSTPEVLSWPSLLALANITAAPSYIKMDIEGWEYEVLHSIVSSGKLLPEQVALELHYRAQGKDFWVKNFGAKNGLGWGMAERQKQPAEVAYFMDFLWRRGRYVLVDRRDNELCPTCTEVLLARADECLVAKALASPALALHLGQLTRLL